MEKKRKMLGIALATTAALAFASSTVLCDVAFAAKANKKVPCYGVNACKGKSACKTAKSSCKGTNACKGQGTLMKTKKQCEKMGGSTEAPM